jgi:hypothetical protein
MEKMFFGKIEQKVIQVRLRCIQHKIVCPWMPSSRGHPGLYDGMPLKRKRFLHIFYAGEVSSLTKVPGRGLEPLRISPPDPKSGASANSATPALRC